MRQPRLGYAPRQLTTIEGNSMGGLHLRSFTGLATALAIAPIAVSQTTLFRAEAQARGDELGYSVAAAGDVNADGYDDVVVGARREYGPSGPECGSARVLSGVDGSTLMVVNGGFAEHLGWSVAGGGDVDGDGHDDIVVGAPSAGALGPSTGRVEVRSGRTGATVWALVGTVPGARFGHAVAGGGDVDGDGFDDVAVGAPLDDPGGRADAGTVRVYSGRTGLELLTFEGRDPGDMLGFSVAIAGDMDRDGFDEVAAGAVRADDNGLDSGSALVFSGRTATILHTVSGDSAGDRCGAAVARIGDVDRDGFADLAVGAPDDDLLGPLSGSVRVVSGLDGRTLATLTYSSAVDGFGTAIAGAGDVDGDGFGDLVVGARLDAREGSQSGAAHVFSGFDGALLHSVFGDSAGDQFGWSVAGAGDADGDGFAEIAVAAVRDGLGGTVRVLHLGATGTPPVQRIHGSGCVGSLGRLPRIGYTGSAHQGEVLIVTLRGGAYSAPDTMFFIGVPVSIPLDPIGLVGCTLLAVPDAPVRIGTNAFGVAEVALRIPRAASALGIDFDAQWIILDPGAPYPLPVATSDALRIRVGS